jgi:hypothetical protein
MNPLDGRAPLRFSAAEDARTACPSREPERSWATWQTTCRVGEEGEAVVMEGMVPPMPWAVVVRGGDLGSSSRTT